LTLFSRISATSCGNIKFYVDNSPGIFHILELQLIGTICGGEGAWKMAVYSRKRAVSLTDCKMTDTSS